jgi:hypothetical protein
MFVAAVMFPQVVLAIHVVVSVAAYGVLICYPVIAAAVERIDPRAVPALLRARLLVSRVLVDPGMVLVVVSGVYLTFEWHQWSQFYVAFGIIVAIVIGGLEGGLVASGTERLAQLAQHDLDLAARVAPSSGGAAGPVPDGGSAADSSAGAGTAVWGPAYLAARTRADRVNILLAALVVAVLCVMVVQ